MCHRNSSSKFSSIAKIENGELASGSLFTIRDIANKSYLSIPQDILKAEITEKVFYFRKQLKEAAVKSITSEIRILSAAASNGLIVLDYNSEFNSNMEEKSIERDSKSAVEDNKLFDPCQDIGPKPAAACRPVTSTSLKPLDNRHAEDKLYSGIDYVPASSSGPSISQPNDHGLSRQLENKDSDINSALRPSSSRPVTSKSVIVDRNSQRDLYSESKDSDADLVPLPIMSRPTTSPIPSDNNRQNELRSEIKDRDMTLIPKQSASRPSTSTSHPSNNCQREFPSESKDREINYSSNKYLEIDAFIDDIMKNDELTRLSLDMQDEDHDRQEPIASISKTATPSPSGGNVSSSSQVNESIPEFKSIKSKLFSSLEYDNIPISLPASSIQGELIDPSVDRKMLSQSLSNGHDHVNNSLEKSDYDENMTLNDILDPHAIEGVDSLADQVPREHISQLLQDEVDLQPVSLKASVVVQKQLEPNRISVSLPMDKSLNVKESGAIFSAEEDQVHSTTKPVGVSPSTNRSSLSPSNVETNSNQAVNIESLSSPRHVDMKNIPSSPQLDRYATGKVSSNDSIDNFAVLNTKFTGIFNNMTTLLNDYETIVTKDSPRSPQRSLGESKDSCKAFGGADFVSKATVSPTQTDRGIVSLLNRTSDGISSRFDGENDDVLQETGDIQPSQSISPPKTDKVSMVDTDSFKNSIAIGSMRQVQRNSLDLSKSSDPSNAVDLAPATATDASQFQPMSILSEGNIDKDNRDSTINIKSSIISHKEISSPMHNDHQMAVVDNASEDRDRLDVMGIAPTSSSTPTKPSRNLSKISEPEPLRGSIVANLLESREEEDLESYSLRVLQVRVGC